MKYISLDISITNGLWYILDMKYKRYYLSIINVQNKLKLCNASFKIEGKNEFLPLWQ